MPETPMPPMIAPLRSIGSPPSSGMTLVIDSSRNAMPPPAIASSKARVGRLKRAAVRALAGPISTLPGLGIVHAMEHHQ